MSAAPTGMPYWVRRRIFQREVSLPAFDGGLNLRDAPTELANNESPDLWNVTLDERGGIQKRFGFEKKNGAAYTTSSPPQQLFEWKHNGVVVTQCGTKLFKDNGVSGVKTFSTADRVGIAEFGTAMYAIHPADGVFASTDGTTWTAVPGSPNGTCLKPWQNRMLSLGDPANPARLSATAIGDALNWSTVSADRAGSDAVVTNGSGTVTSSTAAFTAADIGKQITLASVVYHIAAVGSTTSITVSPVYAAANATGVAWAISGTGWFNDIREHDSEALVAIESASGIDIAGKPGVLVFKANSTYRVNDGDTGAYQTVDTTVGAASNIATTTLYQETFVIHQSGIYQTNGVSPLTLASAKLQPLFDDSKIAFDQTGLFAAGKKGDRIHFSLPRAGSVANDLHIEYHPAQGWMVTGSDAASCYLTFTQGTEKLYGGSPTVAGQVYEMGAAVGSDDGTDITCRYQTKWIAPGGGIETRFRRLRFFGRGIVDLFVKLDFDTGPGTLNNVELPGGGVWGASTWGVDAWGPAKYEDRQDFWSLGIGTHISLVLEETSSKLLYGPPLLEMGSPVPLGAFALYGFDLQVITVSI